MTKLTHEEEIIFNHGERLIPGVTHDMNEFIRHRSSYLFFREVIRKDLSLSSDGAAMIIDLGCGVGHGCATLSALKGCRVVGVDSSAESLEYARRHYGRPNIIYQLEDLVGFIPRMPAVDYAVSRGVLEHVPDGINLALRSNRRKRLMFDVPYAEAAGQNPHHIIHNVDEQTFAAIPYAELFYEDFFGNIYDDKTKPQQPNLIMCVISDPALPPVSSFMKFPILAYQSWDQKLKYSLDRLRDLSTYNQWLIRTWHLFKKVSRRIFRTFFPRNRQP